VSLQLFAASDAAQQELLVSIDHFFAARQYVLSLVVNLEPALSLENVSQPVVQVHVKRNQTHFRKYLL
jgi:hypothetical protein